MNGFDFSALTFEPAQFGKYGSLRLRYLKENKPALYQALLQGNFLNAHLNEIDRQAHEMVEQTVQQLIRNERFDESVKLSNPFLWVQKMNSFKKQDALFLKIGASCLLPLCFGQRPYPLFADFS